MAKRPRPSSSARSAARSRRSGSAAAPTAARGTRSSKSAPQSSGRRRHGGHRYALAGAASAARLYADIEIEQHAAAVDRHRRVRSRARRRHRARDRWCCSAASRASASRRCCCRRRRTWRARSVPVLYSSGEESEHQIKSRGERLGVGDAPLYLLAETCLERILEEIARIKPALVIVDSIQTVFSLKFQSAPGSIGQVREAATQLLFTAKGQNVPTFLVGHVTKDGSLAGPKALEHVVDTVLYFEGERHHSHRVVRAVKNRFGAVSELGVFEMTSAGLRPVPNPSKLFLAERPVERAGLGGAVLGRRVAADSRRGAGARQHQQLRHRAADGERHRSAAAVAAARGARKARRPQPDRRRCVREHRRRDDRRRAGVGPRRARGDRVERPQPRHSGDDGDVRRGRAGRRGARHHARPPLRVREAAQMGFRALHHAGGQHRSRRSDAERRRLRAGRRPDGRRSARRSSSLESIANRHRWHRDARAIAMPCSRLSSRRVS